jgi:hypothetical protein
MVHTESERSKHNRVVPQLSQPQRLKPHLFCGVYVVAKATTHKHSLVATQTLKPGPPKRVDSRRPYVAPISPLEVASDECCFVRWLWS